MKIIVNKFIPFKGFVAMCFFNIIFWRKEYEKLLNDKYYYNTIYNHESIHLAQMKDFNSNVILGGIIFYIIYFFEWIYKFLFKYPFSQKAYRDIRFEKEAYEHQGDINYLFKREQFASFK